MIKFITSLFKSKHQKILDELKGLKVSEEKWNGIFFEINDTTTKSQIKELIISIPFSYSLCFFDHFEPTISDPGAYVTFHKVTNTKMLYHLANHGWTHEWKDTDIDFLTDWIYKNRTFNSDTIHIYPIVKKAILGKRLGAY